MVYSWLTEVRLKKSPKIGHFFVAPQKDGGVVEPSPALFGHLIGCLCGAMSMKISSDKIMSQVAFNRVA